MDIGSFFVTGLARDRLIPSAVYETMDEEEISSAPANLWAQEMAATALVIGAGDLDDLLK